MQPINWGASYMRLKLWNQSKRFLLYKLKCVFVNFVKWCHHWLGATPGQTADWQGWGVNWNPCQHNLMVWNLTSDSTPAPLRALDVVTVNAVFVINWKVFVINWKGLPQQKDIFKVHFLPRDMYLDVYVHMCIGTALSVLLLYTPG